MTQRSTTRMPQLTGVDRVTELVPGVSARGVRGVGGTMDLLDDHFPDFPVLPGVLLMGSLAELAAIVEEFEGATLGDPLDESVDVGPLSSLGARDGVVEQVARAVEQGATLHTGGDALDREGAFMRPAVLTGVTPDMDAYSEEIFGPVAVIYGAESVDHAVELANDVSFGLSGSVWSEDLARAQEVADRLDVGMAYVNEHGTTLPGLPFGGVKRSGFGREMGPLGIEEFLNKKLIRTIA